MGDLAYELNRLAGTTGRETAGAANVWAGTTGLELVGALNAKAGTTGLEFDEAMRRALGMPLGSTDSALGALNGPWGKMSHVWQAYAHPGSGAWIDRVGGLTATAGGTGEPEWSAGPPAEFSLAGGKYWSFPPPSWVGQAAQDQSVVIGFRSSSQPASVAHLWDYSVGVDRISVYADGVADRVFCVENDGSGQIHQVTAAVPIHNGEPHVLGLRRVAGVSWEMNVDSTDVSETDPDTLGAIDLSGGDVFLGVADSGVQSWSRGVFMVGLADVALSDEEFDDLSAQVIASNS
ncbi:MAG: hypothetical protein GY698_18630 [Actinomycetia bacterium]|nr:hypothetical protein [Actinomycetes bacterium]